MISYEIADSPKLNQSIYKGKTMLRKLFIPMLILGLSFSCVVLSACGGQKESIEIKGEDYTLTEFADMLLDNNLLIDEYIGQEATITGSVYRIHSSNDHYMIDGQRYGHKSEYGFVQISPNHGADNYYVDITDETEDFVKSLKQGDVVKVTAVLAGVDDRSSQIDFAFIANGSYGKPVIESV